MNRIKSFLKLFIPIGYARRLKKLVKRVIYFGFKYYCPLCNTHTRIQNPLGFDYPVIKEKQIIGGGLRIVLCPVCNSSDRIRLLDHFLNKHTKVMHEELKLLHVAPEPSLRKQLQKNRKLDYHSADLKLKPSIMIQMDITSIQFENNWFDAVICNHVLEHIIDDGKAMSEIFRVLKPGGWAILQVPISKTLETTYEDSFIVSEKERIVHFGQKDHVRIYGKDYTGRLSKAGFEVQEYIWLNDPEVKKQSRLNLNPDEVIFYCKKPENQSL